MLERKATPTMPTIDRNSSVPYYQQVYDQIAQGIESGLYPAGKKLPSIRECARELAVSNTTIELAYQKLCEEGYVRSRRGSGYTICELTSAPTAQFDRFTDDYQARMDDLVRTSREVEGRPRAAFDFAYDAVDADAFPFTAWARICREVFFTSGAGDACLYNNRQGLYALREQIARYLSGEYGLSCIAEQVLVMPTTRDLVSEITSLFEPQRTTVAMGDPGYDEVRKRLAERGYRTVGIPVWPYPTWEQAKEAIEGAHIVFATPASQFPSNHVMPLDMRRSLVSWAHETGAYLIDDEYGWEFQSGMGRIPSLAALDDAGCVITLGTFSNSFTPAVCLSYAVLPPQLMMKWQRMRHGSHPQVPWQTQAAMAMFMSEGHWRTHIRKTRTNIQRKRRAIGQAIENHLGDAFEIVESANSLFVLVRAREGRTEEELVESALAAGVQVYPTSQYWSTTPPDDWRYVLVGYAGIPLGSIDKGIAALAAAWSKTS